MGLAFTKGLANCLAILKRSCYGVNGGLSNFKNAVYDPLIPYTSARGVRKQYKRGLYG